MTPSETKVSSTTAVLFLIVLGVVSMFLLIIFLAYQNSKETKAPAAAKIQAETVVTEITVGNLTWIPVQKHVNWFGEESPMLVLSLVNEFEKRHPELEIVGTPRLHGNPAGTQTLHGIWIYHRPKTK